MTAELTNADFESKVINSSGITIVDFWAQWCGPCRMVSPIMEELSEKYKGKIKVGKVNIDEEGELAAEFSIVSIPTVMLFKNGKIEERLTGAYSIDDYEDMIENTYDKKTYGAGKKIKNFRFRDC